MGYTEITLSLPWNEMHGAIKILLMWDAAKIKKSTAFVKVIMCMWSLLWFEMDKQWDKINEENI